MPQISFRVLSYLFLLGVIVEFFLAGIGLSELGGESMSAHRAWGYAGLHLIPLLMFGAAIWAKKPRSTLIMIVVLFVLIVVQPFLASDDIDTSWVRAMHVVNGLLIFMLGYHIAQRAGSLRLKQAAE